MRILVAEDEPNIQTLLTFVLRRAGHDAVATSSAEPPNDGAPVDVVVVDLGLCDCDL